MTLEETLTEITTDLVEAERNSPFLQRLVAREAGRWEDLCPLCEGLPEEGRLRAVVATARVGSAADPETGSGGTVIAATVPAARTTDPGLLMSIFSEVNSLPPQAFVTPAIGIYRILLY